MIVFLGGPDDIIHEPKKTWICEGCDTYYFGESPPDHCSHPSCGCRYFENLYDLMQDSLTGDK